MQIINMIITVITYLKMQCAEQVQSIFLERKTSVHMRYTVGSCSYIWPYMVIISY